MFFDSQTGSKPKPAMDIVFDAHPIFMTTVIGMAAIYLAVLWLIPDRRRSRRRSLTVNAKGLS